MKIVFTTIRFKNFLSSGNTMTEIALDQNKQTLIVGENGVGKSLLTEAITFALFNKPYRNINKPQLVNSINQKDLLVELDFSIGDEQYKVRRGIKPTVFEIYKNDKMIDQDADNRDYQQFFEESILKMSYKSFTQTVIMGTASFTPFMQLTAQNRRQVVEDLLDLQIFTTMNIILKSKINDVKNNIQSTQTAISILEEKIKLQKNHDIELTKNKSTQIDHLKEKIGILQADIDQLKLSITNKTEVVNQQVKSVETDIKVKSKLDQYTGLKSQLQVKVQRFESEIKFFETNDQCPTCMQNITEQFKQQAIGERHPQKTELSDAIVQIAEKQKQAQEVYDNAIKLQSEVKALKKEIELLYNMITNKYNDIKQLEKEIDKLENPIDSSDNKIQLSVMQDQLQNQIKQYDQLNTDKTVFDTVGQLLKDTGIKAEIIKTYIPIINGYVNKYLEDMNFFVNFELNENFEEVIKSRHRDIFSYASFSEGEKLRLNLAIIFAWRAIAKIRSSATTNIIFFDEILDSSLDYDGIDMFFKIINDIGSDSNIFVISHKSDMVDKFTNIIRVEKAKGFSKWIL